MSHFSIMRPIESQPATVFSPAISFLRNTLKLPIRQIADALQISETNVGTILSRGATAMGDPGIERLLNPDAAISSMGFCAIYGIRPRASRRALPEATPNLDELAVESNLCLSRHRRAYDFIGGAAALLRIRERIGHPRHPRFILLLARIHAMRCWLLAHVGLAFRPYGRHRLPSRCCATCIARQATPDCCAKCATAMLLLQTRACSDAVR